MDSETVFLTTEEYARRRRTTRATIEVERCRGSGPAYVKFGRAVRYPLSAVLEFERQNLVTPAALQ